MRTLYIDTSSSYLYSGIVEDNKLLCETKKEFAQNLSEEAMPEIAKLFKSINLNAKDIDKIIVVDGPGSFTGIRIGMTIAKVYAWSLNIPITTISALEAMNISTDTLKICVPMINARRGYVFAAAYNNENKAIIEPTHIKMDNLFEKLLGKDYIIITNDDFDINIDTVNYNPDILRIVNHYVDKENINPHAVNPVYLKLTEAEEKKQGWFKK